ncbi:hypothetical protein MTYM_01273 [Methylococcales bacterium]|nr:hypothetical protein MTYM_01273 [Methylococcales bacterium]
MNLKRPASHHRAVIWGRRLKRSVIGITATTILLSSPSDSVTWLVGAQHELKLPSQAAKLAGDGDIVLIAAGSYAGDVASWRQNRLVLRGMGGRPHLKAQGNAAEDKAIWVFKGQDIRVEDIEFSGTAVRALNGAGIRFEGTHLTVINCHFHHNQMGILTGANPASDILIDGSEFNDNSVDYRLYGKLGHNIYIGNIRRFTLRHSYVHDADTGHNVKSRAQQNYLLYNRIGDEHHASSYLVDFPDGGQAFVIGNQLRQSPQSENSTMLSFAGEHNQNQPLQALYLVNNTFVDDRPTGIFVNNHATATQAILINNLLIGHASRMEGLNQQQHNIASDKTQFYNPDQYDYRLSAGARAIGQGIEPGLAINGFNLAPEFQYRHPSGVEIRGRHGPIDVGAYEFDHGH